MFTVNTSSNPVTEHLKKRLKQNIADYEKPEEGERNLYPEGDPRQKIHQYTSSVTDTVGDLGSEAWERTPESIQNFAKGALKIGSSFAESAYEWNLEARETSPSGLGLLDPILAAGWLVDKATKGVSQVTGVDAPIVGVAELFVPYGKVFSTLKNAGKIKPVANVAKLASKTSDLKGAEFAYKASQLNPTFNRTFPEFLSEDLGEVMILNNSKSREVFQELATKNRNIFEKLYPGTTKARKELRKRILSDAGSEYRELIIKYDNLLKDVNPTTIDGISVKISPIPEEQLIKDARRLITLKENLGIPNPKVYQNELGAFIKDDHVARITGGQASSNKIGEFQSTKGFYDRLQRENLYSIKDDPWEGLFSDKNNPRRVAARNLSKKLIKERRTIEADHINILETTTPWAIIKDSKGKYIWRSEKQLEDLTRIMKNKYNIDLGNVNENWMMASIEAHRTGDLAKHVTLGNVTDFQKPLVYADADKIQVVLKNGQTKWLTQTNGQLFDGKTLVKKGDIQKKLNLQLEGRTYTPTQKHGASLELQDTLASIKDTEKLAEAMKLFMIDSGAHEVMAGATTLASYAYDSAKHLDPLTLKIRERNIPAMIKYIDLLLDTPQYKNHRVLHDLKNQFTNRMSSYKKDLQLRGS